MDKVFRGVGLIVLVAFTLAIITFMALMNYQTLGRVFPDDPIQQLWGMALFSGGTVAWFVIFLKASRGFQRPIALVMFGLSLVGEVLYAAADVLMGGQSWVTVNPELGNYVIYSFIALTFFHGAALYIHFLATPEVWAAIDIEAIEDDIKEKAQKRAAELINLRIEPMADQLAARVASVVHANLRLPVPDVIDGVVIKDDPNDLRPAQAATTDAKKAGWFDWLFSKDGAGSALWPRQAENTKTSAPTAKTDNLETPSPAAPTGQADFKLDDLLNRMGISADEARQHLVKYGLDRDADNCFSLLRFYGYLPESMSLEDFYKIHQTLFPPSSETAAAAGATFRPEAA